MQIYCMVAKYYFMCPRTSHALVTMVTVNWRYWCRPNVFYRFMITFWYLAILYGEQFSWGPSHKETITGINNNLPRCKYKMCGYLHYLQNLSSLTLLMLSLSPPTNVDQFASLLHSSPQRCSSPADDNTVKPQDCNAGKKQSGCVSVIGKMASAMTV